MGGSAATADPWRTKPLPPAKPARDFDWGNLGMRAASAAILATVAVGAVIAGNQFLLVLLAVGAALLSIEWAVMSAPKTPIRMATAMTIAILAALFIGYTNHYRIAWIVGAIAAALVALIARGFAERPADAAFGVAYIGIPCLALMWLRAREPSFPPTWTLLLFAVTWFADSAAFLVGSVLKGPKLWPRVSPNKTWSGFLGGLAGATAAAMALNYVLPTGLSPAGAAVVGLVGGVATMGGDLLESMLKRRFGVKDSGDLIPGHGGLLDRVDGLMFAVLAVAALRLIDLVRLGL